MRINAACEFQTEKETERERLSISNSKLTVKTVVSAKRARDVCVILNEWMKIPESAIPLNDFALVYQWNCKERKRKTVDHRTRLSDTFKKHDFVSNAIQVELCCFST